MRLTAAAVTLDGTIIHKSGLITGGRSSQQSGRLFSMRRSGNIGLLSKRSMDGFRSGRRKNQSLNINLAIILLNELTQMLSGVCHKT